MDRTALLHRLSALKPELARLGVEEILVFGSMARGDGDATSDLDVGITIASTVRGLDRLAVMEDVAQRLSETVGRPVDVIECPVRSPAMRKAMAKDGIHVV